MTLSPKMIAELRGLLACATEGDWQVQDGCSWRRIGTAFHDGDVLCPTNSRTDGHPDLTCGTGENLTANLRLIVAMKNVLPSLLDALDTRHNTDSTLREALEPFARAADKRQVGAPDDERVTWSAITVGDLRRARAALHPLKVEGG